MAGQSSNIGANPTTAANVDFGKIMNQSLDRLALNQERDRLEAEREAKRNQEFEDKYGINEDQYVLEDTKFRDINDAATEAVSLLRDRRWKVYQELKQNPSDENKKRLGNIDNSVKKLAASNKKMSELSEQFVTMLENDEVSGVDEDRIRNMIESVERGDIKVHLDDDDNMSYLFYDKNKKLQDVSSFGDLIKESPMKRIDLDTELDAIVKAVGTDEIDTVTGRYIKSSNVFGEDQARFVNGEIDAFLGTDERSLETNPALADLLNQATGGSSKKRSNFTEDERQFVKNYLQQQVKDRFNESIKLKERQQPRAPSATDLKQPSLNKLNPATTGDNQMLVEDGKAVLTYAGGLKLEESGSNLAIDDIRISPQGEIELRGTDKIKKKGKQGETKEAIQEKEGVPMSMIEFLLQDDGTYVYNVTAQIEPITGQAAINKLGNLLRVENQGGLTDAIKAKLAAEFGQEAADAFFAQAQQKDEQKAPAVPKEVKTQSGSTYK